MLFLPIKADFPLPRIPVLTFVVCLVCVGVFMAQLEQHKDFFRDITRYCYSDQSRLEQMVFERMNSPGPYTAECRKGNTMHTISTAEDSEAMLDEIASGARPLVGFSAEDSREYIRQMLEEELVRYERIVPEHPNVGFAYYTGSWNVWHMITSAFSHGDFWHIFFNLIVFVAFAATVEALAGPIMFVVSVLAISLFTGVFSSISGMASGVHFWTLGLSGVVWGMMGLFGYLLPRGNIRCFFWFFVIVGTVAIPGWVLSLWFVGKEVFAIFATDDHGFVNVMAHATGGISGYLFGVLFLRRQKEQARDLQLALDVESTKPKF
ncbi:MAG: rhomboid family intramembrane serine protease [Woeseiaceae bacterium]|nr:rhomboid family intramembrane serine protease [Woeseiaceae bacterium]